MNRLDLRSTSRLALHVGTMLLGLWVLPAFAGQPTFRHHPQDATYPIDCNECHAPHGGDYGGLVPTGAQQTALCASCHNESHPSGASQMTNIGDHNHGKDAGPQVDCGYCHDVHGSQTGANIKLIRTDPTHYVPAAATPEATSRGILVASSVKYRALAPIFWMSWSPLIHPSRMASSVTSSIVLPGTGWRMAATESWIFS